MFNKSNILKTFRMNISTYPTFNPNSFVYFISLGLDGFFDVMRNENTQGLETKIVMSKMQIMFWSFEGKEGSAPLFLVSARFELDLVIICNFCSC